MDSTYNTGGKQMQRIFFMLSDDMADNALRCCRYLFFRRKANATHFFHAFRRHGSQRTAVAADSSILGGRQCPTIPYFYMNFTYTSLQFHKPMIN